MKYLSSFLIALGLCLTVSGTVHAQRYSEAMQELIDEWEAHFNNANFDAISFMYTSDAVRFPPGAPAQLGHDVIVADLAKYSDLTIELNLLGSLAEGGLSTAWGTYALYSRSGDGDGPVQSGPWMNVVVLGEDGTWRIHRDIWNIRQAAMPEPSAE